MRDPFFGCVPVSSRRAHRGPHRLLVSVRARARGGRPRASRMAVASLDAHRSSQTNRAAEFPGSKSSATSARSSSLKSSSSAAPSEAKERLPTSSSSPTSSAVTVPSISLRTKTRSRMRMIPSSTSSRSAGTISPLSRCLGTRPPGSRRAPASNDQLAPILLRRFESWFEARRPMHPVLHPLWVITVDVPSATLYVWASIGGTSTWVSDTRSECEVG